MKEEYSIVNHTVCIGKITALYEIIKVIQDGMTDDEYHGYLKGNVLKYVSRYKFKGEPLEDLEKAQWYLNRLIKEVT